MNQTKDKQSKLPWPGVVLLWGLLMPTSGVMAVQGERGAAIASEMLTDNNGQFNLYHQSHALLIGNIHYQHWNNLPTIKEELNKVADMLRSQGFKVHSVWDLDAAQLPSKLKEFLSQYGAGEKNRNNRLLVFYSGHGETRKGFGGRDDGYIIPIDSPQKSQPGFLNKALSMDDIVNWSEKISTRHILFMFDSCFSGSILETRRSGERIPEHIHESVKNPVRQFLTAGGANELVPADSRFTPAFIRAIKEQAADYTGDGYVTGTELSMYLAAEVPKYTKQRNHPQEGKIGDGEHRTGDFVFALKQTAIPTNPADKQAEIAYWNSIKDRQNPDYFQAYLDSYGETGIFSGIAKINLNEFKTGQATSVQNKARLTVRTSPEGARVRILNIGPKYQDAIKLKPGRYHIEVTHAGYPRYLEWIELGNEDSVHTVVLDKKLQLADEQRGKTIPSTPSINSATTPATMTDSVTGMKLVNIPSGCFQMGSNNGSGREKPIHRVCITQDYDLGQYEVTQGQWKTIMGSNPSEFKKGDNYPVETVSWNDIQDFIRKLNAKTGKHYRLPTEAEWEYACRSGGKNQTYCGSNSAGSVAWYSDNSGYQPHPVGQKRAKG
jgi:uncharacterized caspase-like protein